MTRAPTLGIYPGAAASRILTSTIVLLQLLALVSPVLSYRGDISRARLPPASHLLRGPPGVPGLVTPREKNPFSPHAFSRRKRDQEGGVAPKVVGTSESVTDEECKGMGLEKCGDVCVAQCCNAESALACPVNAYCTSNGEYEFCCEKGHTCDEPVECLDLADQRCSGNAGELITDEDGDEKACCYTGFEVCTTIWDGLPACMPTGVVEVPPKPARHTHTGSYDHDVAHRTSSPSTGNVPTSTPTSQSEQDADDEDDDEEDTQHKEGYKEEFIDTDNDGEDDDDDSYPNYSGTGALVGGLVGGILGLAILGTCAFFTGRFYRRKRKEEQEKEQAFKASGADGGGVGGGMHNHDKMGIRGGANRGTASWNPRINLPSPQSSSWSNYTLSGTPALETSDEKLIIGKLANNHPHLKDQVLATEEEGENPTSPGKRRSNTIDSGVDPNSDAVTISPTEPAPVHIKPRGPGTSPSPVFDTPFDWRKCTELNDSISQPIFKSPPKSPRIGPTESMMSILTHSSGSGSSRGGGGGIKRESPPLMTPKSPRLEANMATMSGALQVGMCG